MGHSLFILSMFLYNKYFEEFNVKKLQLSFQQSKGCYHISEAW